MKTKKSGYLMFAVLFMCFVSSSYAAETVVYTDSFIEWANIDGDIVIQDPNFPGRFGDTLDTSNTNELKWNLTQNSDPNSGWNSYSVSVPGTISSIKFDWQFNGDGVNALFQLLNDSDVVVWTATTGSGTNEVVAVNSQTLKFEYRQAGAITGDPNFFSGPGDWDALVDNVTLTFDLAVPASTTTVHYFNDFTSWANFNEDDPAIGDWRFGGWLATDNSTALVWDMTVPSGSPLQERWNRYTINSPGPITQIEFDWRFANDEFDPRLRFELVDEVSGIVLWTATSTGGGVSKPINVNEIVQTNTTVLSFRYFNPVLQTLSGEPGLFTLIQDDWDAYVDNVTLTVQGTCSLDGDINGDCVVNHLDLIILGTDWLKNRLP